MQLGQEGCCCFQAVSVPEHPCLTELHEHTQRHDCFLRWRASSGTIRNDVVNAPVCAVIALLAHLAAWYHRLVVLLSYFFHVAANLPSSPCVVCVSLPALLRGMGIVVLIRLIS